MTKPDNSSGRDPARLITRKIASLGDWRGEMLAQLRDVIHKADPDIREEWKWGTAAWAHDGMVCSAGTFKDHVKLNFFQGAAWTTPGGSSTPASTPRRRGPSTSGWRTRSTSPP